MIIPLLAILKDPEAMARRELELAREHFQNVLIHGRPYLPEWQRWFQQAVQRAELAEAFLLRMRAA